MGGTMCLLSSTPKNMGGTCPPVPHPNKAHGKVWANTILTESSSELSHSGFIQLAHSVSSQWTHKISSHCELSGEFATHTVISLLPLYMVSSSGDLTNSSQQARRMRCKLTKSSQHAHSVSHLVTSLYGNWVSSKWAFCEFQCELKVS